MTKEREKGTRAETIVTSYLQGRGWPHAERRAMSGAKDRGDIAGVPGVVWEVKSGARLKIPDWLAQTETERVNDRATFGVLVVKPKGLGALRVADWWAVLKLGTAVELLQAAGF